VYKVAMLKYIFQIFTILFFLISSLKSEEFNNILISGNERISDESILVFSDISNDKFLDEDSINDVLKKLYQTGFFKEIVVKVENKNLIIAVIENPIIQSVFIEGIKKKKTKEALYEILSLKDRSSFNSSLVTLDETSILKLLKNDGYYFQKLSHHIKI